MTDALSRTTTYTYDADNELTKVTQPGGTTVNYAYDGNGNQVKQTNAAGHSTTYAYDLLNRVISITDPLGRVTLYAYDGAGNRTSLTDPSGHVTKYGFDAANELTSVSYSDGKTPNVSYTYTSDGQRATMVDGTGTTTYTYDSLNRLTSVTDGPGKTTGYAYDLNGNLTTLTYPNGQPVTRTYDKANQLTKVTDWLGHTTSFAYSADGALTSEKYPNAVQSAIAYNNADQVTSITDTAGSATLAKFGYTRDSLGQVTSVSPSGAPGVPGGNQSYSYTQLDQLASSNGSPYAYDLSGNLTKNANGTTQAFDAASELTSATAPPLVLSPLRDQVVSASLTKQGASVTSPAVTTKSGGELVLAFISADGPPGKTQQISKVTGGGLTWTRVVRANGQPGAAEVWQAHAAGKLKAVKITAFLGIKGNDASITIATFTRTNGIGAKAAASAKTGAPAVSLTTTKASSLVLAVGIDWTNAVKRTPVAGQSLVEQYLDSKAHATYWLQTAGTGHAAHVAVKVADKAPTGDRSDFAAVEITSTLAAAVKTTYTYDPQGNRTGISRTGNAVITLTYDQANRLIGYGTAASYAYNGDGLRMSKTVGAKTTVFTWDQSDSLPLLISDGSAYYVFGAGGEPTEQISGTTVTYLHTEQQGSVRLLTSSGGKVVGTYTYDPYGKVTRITGTAATPLQYDGQYVDVESGLQYLVARYYDPSTGQFTSVDPVVAVTQTAYGYAYDNPVNLTDPSGQCPWCVGAIIGGITGAVTGAIGCFTGDMSAKECAASVVGGAIGGAVGGACAASTLGVGAAACGAAGSLTDDLIQKYVFGQDLSPGEIAVDVGFGAIGGRIGDKLFATKGRLPSNPSNILHPGTNAAREYLSGLVGGEIGLIPGLFKPHPVC